jgi:hypothetical protein
MRIAYLVIGRSVGVQIMIRDTTSGDAASTGHTNHDPP